MLRNETLFVLIRKQRCCYTNLENQTALTNIIRDMILNSEINEFDVIIVGGGATGAGTARDCALRGMRVLLVERFDFAAGATGRNHGLLHSGARYAVTDRESAAECIKENMILPEDSTPLRRGKRRSVYLSSGRRPFISKLICRIVPGSGYRCTGNRPCRGEVDRTFGESCDNRCSESARRFDRPFQTDAGKCHRRQGSRCESAGVSRSDRIDSRAGKSCRSHGT